MPQHFGVSIMWMKGKRGLIPKPKGLVVSSGNDGKRGRGPKPQHWTYRLDGNKLGVFPFRNNALVDRQKAFYCIWSAKCQGGVEKSATVGPLCLQRHVRHFKLTWMFGWTNPNGKLRTPGVPVWWGKGAKRQPKQVHRYVQIGDRASTKGFI